MFSYLAERGTNVPKFASNAEILDVLFDDETPFIASGLKERFIPLS